ncbi:MAG: hypothetical protein WC423_18340 [Vulcanimicrobiota bacterium]
MKRRSTTRNRGIGLALLLALTAVILVLGASAVALIAQLSQQVSSSQRASKVKYAAKAGLSRALLELSKDPHWSPTTLVLPDASPDSFDFRDNSLGCKVQVVNNWGGAAPVSAPDSTMVEPGRVWLESVGTLHGEPLSGAHGIAAGLAVKPEVVFDLAVYQRDGIFTIQSPSVLIASYRSSGAATDPKDPAGVLESEAVIRSEVGVIINAASQLRGKVQLPRVDIPVAGNLAGLVEVVPDGPLPLQFTEPEALRSLPHPSQYGTALDLDPGPYFEVKVEPGGSLVLRGGTYYIDSLWVGEGSVVELVDVTDSNPCVVYLGEIFDVGPDAEINWQRAPALLQLYSTDRDNWGADQFILGNNSRSSFVIASDVLELALGEGAVLYGAVDARLVTWAAGARLIFDENLIGQVLDGDPEWVLVSETD